MEGSSEGQAQAPDWTEGLSEDSRATVDVKGWDSADKAIESYRNLEKMVGADPNQVLKLPTDPDSEEWGGVYSRLGRPETAQDYKIELPEGVEANEKFMDSAKETFHEAGLSGKQAQAVVDLWQNQVESDTKARQEAIDLQSQTDINELKREWGNGYDSMIETGKRAAIEFGLTQEQSEAMETSMGTKDFLKLWSSIGSKIGEPALEGGNESPGVTPASAKAKIDSLMADESFLKTYQTPNVPGHDEAVKKIQKLYELAYV